ncbi:MAG: hypothetical protein U1F30_14250 [Steroidobacteraceae bacterium]
MVYHLFVEGTHFIASKVGGNDMKRIIVTVALAVAAGGAWGQSPAASEDDVAKARSFIKGLDKDSNGTLSRAETKGFLLDADFDKIDTDHDGALDARELAGFKARNPGAGAPREARHQAVRRRRKRPHAPFRTNASRMAPVATGCHAKAPVMNGLLRPRMTKSNRSRGAEAFILRPS